MKVSCFTYVGDMRWGLTMVPFLSRRATPPILATRSGMPGDDLLGALMNGVVGKVGGRRWPMPIDFAILADLGYRTTLPTWLAGDLNADGMVNAADYTVWRDNNGATGLNIPGDGNLDRVVNYMDLDGWQDDFGFQFVASLSLSVPEPTSGWIMVGWLVGLACRPVRYT